MKTFAIMRPTNYSERETAKAEGKEFRNYKQLLTCPTKENAEKLLKAIERYSFMANLVIEEIQ